MQKNKTIISACLLLALFAGCKPLEEIDDPEGEKDPKTIAELLQTYRCAYYTFDNETAMDMSVSGERYNGVLIGDNVKFLDDTPSGTGKSLFLNGAKEQYVNIPFNIFKDLDDFTISFWIKDFYDGSIISGISSSTMSNAQWPRIYMKNDGRVLFWVKSSGYYDNPSFSYNYLPLQSSGWHNLAVTCTIIRNHDCNLKLYVDGVLVDNVNANWENSGGVVTKVHIGGDANGVFSVFSTMKIDNVSVFSATLGDGVIKYIYDNKL